MKYIILHQIISAYTIYYLFKIVLFFIKNSEILSRRFYYRFDDPLIIEETIRICKNFYAFGLDRFKRLILLCLLQCALVHIGLNFTTTHYAPVPKSEANIMLIISILSYLLGQYYHSAYNAKKNHFSTTEYWLKNNIFNTMPLISIILIFCCTFLMSCYWLSTFIHQLMVIFLILLDFVFENIGDI